MYLCLVLAACKTDKGHDRKLEIATQIVNNDFICHFSVKTPPGHPSRISEIIYNEYPGTNRPNDTVKREYLFGQDLLTQVNVQQSGSNYTILFRYDSLGRLTSLDNISKQVSYNKDTFTYDHSGYREGKFNYISGKLDEITTYIFYPSSDSIAIMSSPDSKEKLYFSESGDSVIVTRKWQDQGILLSHKIETYNKQNLLTSVTFLQDGKVDRRILYTYDTHGNGLSRVDKDDNNSVGGNGIMAVSKPSTYSTSYEYDSLGNWTKKLEREESGSWKAVTERQITYGK
ncbi:hypothetical protein CLV59_105370 [Chitinophaga dinghuensis]|uniref:YD repeat-containing protein n=2 Tax=Chitinophaga dinghuensis TaxID=1539050 RepID=A0A327VXN6_9BACT|nr:hypothetical protein CLV59_105370 [Chitinophaga dinghuensis]